MKRPNITNHCGLWSLIACILNRKNCIIKTNWIDRDLAADKVVPVYPSSDAEFWGTET